MDDTTGDRPVTVAVLTKGASFGEQALLYKTQRSHTVRAAGTLLLLELSSADFDLMNHEFPELKESFEAHIQQYTEFNFLRSLGILSKLTLGQTQELMLSIETINLKAGEFLFHEGESGDSAYIIREGRIRIIKESTGTNLAVVKAGNLIGEMSLIYSQPRSAGAVAVEDTVVLCLRREVFDKFIANQADAHGVVIEQATKRLLQNETMLASVEAPAEEHQHLYALHASQVKVGWGIFVRTYPFVQVEIPVLAGIACLDMINRFYRQEHTPQETIEQQLLEGQPDTLLTVSRKAEAQGYLTRLLKLDNDMLVSPAFPAIVEVEDGQLAVVFAVSSNHVVLANPVTGIERIPREVFVENWTGQLLVVTYSPNFGSVGTETKKIFKQFFPLARPYLQLVAAIGVVTLIIQLFGLAAPLFSKIIIDKVLVNGDMSLLFLMLLGMLFVTGFQLASGTLRQYLIAHVLRRISVSLLLRFFNHILSLPQRIFSTWQVGDFITRFEENEKLLELVSQSGFKIIVDSLTILVYLIVLLSSNAKLTGVALIFVAAYGVVMLISSPMLRANDRRVFENYKNTESHMIEAVTGIQTIKSLASEDLFFGHAQNLFAKLKLSQFKGALLAFNIGLISNLINKASMVAILGYGAKLTLSGELTTGELVAFNALLGLLLTPLMSLIGVWDEIQELRISFERTNDVLQLEPEKQDETAVMPVIEGHVRFENVSFRYPESETDVLMDINLEVLPGQKMALVGRSGSGKTTLVNLLINLYQPTSGTILVDGMDINQIQLSSLRRQLGVVEQHPFLFSGTIRENIAKAAPSADFESVVAAATLAGAHEFIEEFPMGYDTQIGERGMTLSGGQKQRLIIARALLTNPRILILDEATASLDTESEQIIQKNLDTFMADRTTFIIAHRLSTVRNADFIVVLDEGCIVEMGTHSELMEKLGLYYYLHSKSK